MSMPRIARACSSASARSPASLIPPALPRPPISTCALTTHGYPSSSAAATACSTVVAGTPLGTGTPWRANSCLPWYSRRSIGGADSSQRLAAAASLSECCVAYAAPQGSHLRHVRRLRNPDRLGDGCLPGVLEGGRE